MKQIEALYREGLELNARTHKFRFFFCSDWKFLSIIMGLKAANSKFFCPWCLCTKSEREDLDFAWNLYSRNWESESVCPKCIDATGRKPLCQRSHHQFEPIKNLLKHPFKSTNVLLDTLHITLRTSDVLEKILFKNVDEYSLCEKLLLMCKNAGLKIFALLFIHLMSIAGIPLKWVTYDKKNHISQWTSLNEHERIDLWRSINFEELFSGTEIHSDHSKWRDIANEWLMIIDYLNCLHVNCHCTLSTSTFAVCVKRFCRKLKLLETTKITPYLHCMLQHIPRMLEQHVTLKKFSTSAQELSNSTQTLQQFRCTNQQNVPHDLIVYQGLLLWFQLDLATQTKGLVQRFPKFTIFSP